MKERGEVGFLAGEETGLRHVDAIGAATVAGNGRSGVDGRCLRHPRHHSAGAVASGACRVFTRLHVGAVFDDKGTAFALPDVSAKLLCLNEGQEIGRSVARLPSKKTLIPWYGLPVAKLRGKPTSEKKG